MPRPLRNNASRLKVVPYTATINFAPGSGDVFLKVGTLTGNLALNIVDPNAKDGDVLRVALLADASARTVTIGGAQGASGTVAIGAGGVAVVSLVFTSIIGKYASSVVPT